MRRRFWMELLIVLALTGLALALRLYQLPTTPPGLYIDEAANGLDVLEILSGQRPIFFERNFGREPLFIYLQAISVAVLGATPFALRLTAAVLGALTAPAIYWMVREAFADAGTDSRWLGLWTALFVAVSYWHINFSRLGFRVIMLPLLSAIAFAWFWRAWHRIERGNRFPWLDSLLCGVFVGISLYTYLSARFLPVLMFGVGVIGIAMCRQRKAMRRPMIMALVVIAIVALAVFAPLGLYFLQNPQSFLGHASSVSVFNPYYNQGNAARALAESVVKTVGMFVTSGDPNLRHNPARRPLLDPVLAAWLLLGLILSVRKWRSLPRLWGVTWIGLFAIPVILGVEGMPHSLRGLGMLPAVFMLPVLAMDDVRTWLANHLRAISRPGRYASALLPLPFLLLSAVTSLQDYFTVWQRDKGLAIAFETESIRVAQSLAPTGDRDRVWLLPLSPLYDGTTFNYTLDFTYRGPSRLGFVRADPASAPDQLNALTSGLSYGQLINWPDASPPMSAGWLTYADPKQLIDFLLSKHGRKIESRQDSEIPYSVYELPATPDYRVATAFDPLNASFGGKVRLTAAAYGRTAIDREESVVALDQHSLPAGHSAWAALRWQAQQPIDYDLKASLRLLDDQGHVAGQVDDLLVGDSYPFTRTWQTGEVAGTYHILPTLPALAPGSYQLHVVVYNDKTREVYPVVNEDGLVKAGSARIGSLEITRATETPAVAPENPLPDATCWDSSVCLLGFDVSARAVSPGDPLALTLYWRAQSQPATDYQVDLQLRDASGTTVASRQIGPADGRYPTARWQTGEIVRDWHDLAIPSTLPAGAYQLAVALRSEGSNAREVSLGEIHVTGRPHDFSAPTIQQPMEIRVGDRIRLLGYTLGDGSVRAGNPLNLTLHWQAVDQLRNAYTVFVHIVDSNGQIVAQQDSVPGQGTAPTSSWARGEYIGDTYQIPLRPNLASGAYQIRIGMYDATTGARLPISDANGRPMSDFISLSEPITITAQ